MYDLLQGEIVQSDPSERSVSSAKVDRLLNRNRTGIEPERVTSVLIWCE